VTPQPDEVNAVVIDLGTYLCRAGFAGDDTPKAAFPSVRRCCCCLLCVGGAVGGRVHILRQQRRLQTC
jgi:hypothetical protein